MSDTEDAQVIQAVSTKLPAFNSKRPDLWFCQVEAEFATTGVKSEDTKYSHVIKTLTPEAINLLEHSIIPKPTTDPYKTIKKAILEEFTPTEAERFEAMLDVQPLGDMKPSAWAAQMQALLPSKDDAYEFLVRNVFLRRLPLGIRQPLARDKFTTLHALSTEADKLWAADKYQSPTMAEVQAANRMRQGSGTPATSRQKPEADQSSSPFCWRHRRFKEQAHKCEGGSCSWPKNGQVGSSN